MRSSLFPNVMAGTLTACALVVTALLVRRELFPPTPSTEPAMSTVRNWKEYASVGHRMGRNAAPVELVEFSDFQCPFCRLLVQRIDSVLKVYPDKVLVIYRHDPISEIHPYAHAAALAAECAGQQGRFAEYYHALFTKQDSIGRLAWIQFARQAQVPDSGAFARCVRDSVFISRVRTDVAAATKLGVQGTPGLLVNDEFVQGTPSQERLNELVKDALQESSAGSR